MPIVYAQRAEMCPPFHRATLDGFDSQRCAANSFIHHARMQHRHRRWPPTARPDRRRTRRRLLQVGMLSRCAESVSVGHTTPDGHAVAATCSLAAGRFRRRSCSPDRTERGARPSCSTSRRRGQGSWLLRAAAGTLAARSHRRCLTIEPPSRSSRSPPSRPPPLVMAIAAPPMRAAQRLLGRSRSRVLGP